MVFGSLKQLQQCSRLVFDTWYLHRALPVTTLQSPFCQPQRFYAKGKERGSVSSGKKSKQTDLRSIDVKQLQDLIDVSSYEKRLDEELVRLRHEFLKQLALRTSANSFESLEVKTPDGIVPLNHLAKVTLKNPQMLVVNASSSPHAVKSIMTAIKQSGISESIFKLYMFLGMNVSPQQDNLLIYVPLPKPTREHREQLAKNAHMLTNLCKQRLSKIEADFAKQLDVKEASGTVPKDLLRKATAFLLARQHEVAKKAEKMEAEKKDELLKEFT